MTKGADHSQNTAYTNALLITFFGIIAYFLVKVLSLDTLGTIFDKHWQFIDFQELMQSPARSLLFLHSQPPLLNFLVWFLSLFPGDLYQHFLIINACCVAIIAWIIFEITNFYLPSKIGSFSIAMAYLVAPATILNVAYPFYPCLTSLGYALLVYAFFLVDKNTKYALTLFVFSLTYLAMLRSSFSLLHTGFFCAAFYYYAKDKIHPKSCIIIFIISLLLALIVPIKNYTLYGFFGSSSWAPLNLAQGFGVPLTLGYFPSPQEIKAKMPALECSKHYGYQDTAFVKHNGKPNYNSCYLIEYAKLAPSEIHKNYQFKSHFKHFTVNSLSYFSPPNEYYFLSNRPTIEGYANAINTLFATIKVTPLRKVRLLLLIILAGSMLVACRKKQRFLAICLIIIITHFITHSLTDGGEGARFVFDIEFLFYILSVITITIQMRAQKTIKVVSG